MGRIVAIHLLLHLLLAVINHRILALSYLLDLTEDVLLLVCKLHLLFLDLDDIVFQFGHFIVQFIFLIVICKREVLGLGCLRFIFLERLELELVM